MSNNHALILSLSIFLGGASFADSTNQHAEVVIDHHHEDDCPVCLEQRSCDHMMCENGHSMGCESCVEAIAIEAVSKGREPQCPLCRKAFDLGLVREQSPRILREVSARRHPQPSAPPLEEDQPIIIDCEAIRQQIIERERLAILQELGEEGRARIRAQHFDAIRRSIRDNFSAREIEQAKLDERNRIVQDIRTELRQREEDAIRREQRRLVDAGHIVLINAVERAAIEKDQFHRMQDEERLRIRHARRRQIQEEGIQLISAEEKQQIMSEVIAQMKQEEQQRKARALDARRASIVRSLWIKNGLIWLSNCVPFVQMVYYDYAQDVEQRLHEMELTDPA